MRTLYFFKKPVVLSVTIALLVSVIYSLVTVITLGLSISSLFLWAPISTAWFGCLLFNLIHYRRRLKAKKEELIETEEETLSDSLSELLSQVKNKPVYLIVGNKGSGKEALLFSANAIKPIDKKRTVKTDFYTWLESDVAVYLKPNQRLIFQEQSNTDKVLWNAFIQQLIVSNPRKPLSGCLLCCDLEYLITHEEEQVEYTLDILKQRLTYITEATTCSLPLYLFITKLDKLHGFKEYMSVSPIKNQVEHLSIPLRDAKGAITDYFIDSYSDIVSKLESHVLECTAKETDWNNKQAIIGFPKQFELCHNEVLKVLHFVNDINSGLYFLDIRGIYFTSSRQSGRKYNLLAKSCSSYFNLPIIASEYSQLSETPYFTRFIIDSHVLPEGGFAGENKRHLNTLIRQSRITLFLCFFLISGSGYLLFSTLKNNISTINSLLNINRANSSNTEHGNFHDKFVDVINQLNPHYLSWYEANNTLKNELIDLNLSRVDDVTKIAYISMMSAIGNKLAPFIEQSLSLELAKSKSDHSHTLELLKAYLMLSEVDKRNIPFLLKQVNQNFSQTIRNQDAVARAMELLDVYLRTDFQPLAINWDLVRSTRRLLLSRSKVDMVYTQILSQAKNTDLGTLDLDRAIGFEFNDVFEDRIDEKNFSISKLFTATGYSTFYRPRSELLSKQVILDNWVLGLSNNVVPTDIELKSFSADVRKKYTDNYITYWRNAISEFRLKRFTSIVDLTNTIDLMSGPSSPLTTVLKILYNNTKFSPDEDYLAQLAKKNELLDAAIEIGKEKVEDQVEPDYVLMSRVEQSFNIINQLQLTTTDVSNSSWDQIITALSNVRTYLKGITDAPNISEAALVAAKSRMRATEADPLIRLKQIAQKTPEPIKSWLMDIVNQTWALLLSEAQKGIQLKWSSEVWNEFRTIGLNRYPFSRDAKEEMSIIEFEKFFATAGTLHSFIKENLAPFYDTNLWQPKQVDGEYLPLSQELVIQLQNYNVIQKIMIDHSSNRFRIPFNAKVIDMDSSAIRANVTLADQTINYYHGPTKVKELSWPPMSGDFVVSLTIQDISKEGKQHTLTKEGQWALYRLFDESDLIPTQDGGFIAEIKVAGRELKVKFKPSAPSNPFTLIELFNFSLPKEIS